MSLPNSVREPSLCIPKMDHSVREQDIRRVFTKLDFGEIDRVDIVSWKNSRQEQNFVRVFIHLKEWKSSAEQIRMKLLDGETYNIVYNFPWFWKIVASRLPKPTY